MRAFVIADASKRKARPVALLIWEPDANSGQGHFALEVVSTIGADDLPLSLSFCVDRPGRRATPAESEEWVRSRIVPQDRHNIVEVLLANGLSEYDEIGLLAACSARSSDDDFLAYEVALSEEVATELSQMESPMGSHGGSCGGPHGVSQVSTRGSSHGGEEAPSRADRVISMVERKRRGSRVAYALVDLPEVDSRDEVASIGAARRVGEQIRFERQRQGLTQRQLAARSGVTQTVLSRVESGTGNPTLGLLEEIAAALGMSFDIQLR